jgi:SOS-response transcriptional repressor LexA
MTHRQGQVLDFLIAHWGRVGAPPTIRDICNAMGWKSTNAATNILLKLEGLGFIERRGSRRYRSIFVVRPKGCCPACGHALGVKP